MDFLMNPNVAYVVLMVGFLLSVLAVFTPGTGLLEMGALFLLIIAGYGILSYGLPLNWWALVFLVISAVPMVFAVRHKRHWVWLAAAVVLLTAGSVFLFQGSDGSLVGIHPALSIAVSLITVGILWLIGRKGFEAMARPAKNYDDLIGKTGEARTDVLTEGSVYIDGEIWTARSKTIILAGSTVKVVGREGLVLFVEPV